VTTLGKMEAEGRQDVSLGRAGAGLRQPLGAAWSKSNQPSFMNIG
jgi:hypothetical protein